MLLSLTGRERHSSTDDTSARCFTTLHLHPCFQVNSVFGRLESGLVKAPQHLRNNGIDMLGVQPADKLSSLMAHLLQHSNMQSCAANQVLAAVL